jgi:2-polyprenyl-3-methyl-5-hydroxy-6-metoxy-1,4-benzoquinol methylase
LAISRTYRESLPPLADTQLTVRGMESTYWERVARSRWGQYVTALEKRAILKGASLAARQRTALEIGCEGGRWSKLLADSGWHVVCTDVDSAALKICKERIPSAQCVLVSPEDNTIPSGTATIDLLLCMEVPAVAHSDWFIHEAFRVLSPGAVLVGAVMNKFSHRALLHRLSSKTAETHTEDDPAYQLDYRKFRSTLLRSGFSFIQEEGCCWNFFRRDSDSAAIPVLVEIERRLGLRKIPTLSPWIIFVARKGADSLT